MTLTSVSSIDRKVPQSAPYDAVLASVGFEPRARFIAKHYGLSAPQKHASVFPDRHVHDFDANIRFYRKSGYSLHEHDNDSYYDWVISKLLKIVASSDQPTICVDISSMSRFRLASVVEAALRASYQKTVTVDFLYAIARYSPPNAVASPITELEPVLPTFAGWSNNPGVPATALFGLGYEPDKVIGAIEFFEPDSAWACVPIGNDERFLKRVLKSNRTALGEVPLEQRIEYYVLQPFNSFTNLETLCFGLLRNSRPILVPFGPKVFALLCLLVSVVHPEIGVWRVSGGAFEEPIGREAHGAITGVRCEFRTHDAFG